MMWIKKDLIFCAKGQFDWMSCYTTPVATIELKSKFRIYFSTRSKPDINGNFISNCSFIDVDKKNPNKVLYIHDKLIIETGGPGSFDEFGIMVAKPVIYNEKVYLYYMGWQRLCNQTAPYQVMLGLAISEDDGLTFKKISKGPIMGIDTIDPISIGNISVLIEDDVWKMWYTSYTRWEFGGIKPAPEYEIKYAESKDGIIWNKLNIICIPEEENGGVATPSVLNYNGIYHMWFGYRPPFDQDGNVHAYKIGYASSSDGKIWTRNDSKSGISISKNGWDSEMVCYPHILKLKDEFIMFYCGNGFGYSGFGYATIKNLIS
jgi:hypothetical protein